MATFAVNVIAAALVSVTNLLVSVNNNVYVVQTCALIVVTHAVKSVPFHVNAHATLYSLSVVVVGAVHCLIYTAGFFESSWSASASSITDTHVVSVTQVQYQTDNE